MLKYQPPTIPQLRRLAEELRAEDETEIRGMWGDQKLIAIGASAIHSRACYIASDQDENLVALFGIGQDPTDEDVGHPWLLCTPLVKNHRIELMRQARESVRRWRWRFKTLLGYVHEDNHEAIRFIEALGFSIESGTTYTFNNPLIRFRKFILCASP